ncbi:DUF924 family protein [Salinisphaera sp. LB1]|uniref:DUF924 family protein n=1 Tax=Salinisphaera sp. LB1 TaxID=2183911 RepID=UPI000D706B57|nr:DUF924 family protein [Salinisphaera sp. LB1]AWN17273.1 Protein of unknown function DUF924 [Salinisphaera sp. LB1]
MNTPAPAREVHAFWFDILEPRDWFTANSRLDRRIAAEFGALIPAARAETLAYWRVSPTGRLAEILVLDQFSRNVFRGHAEAFAGDELALALAKKAIEAGAPRDLAADERAFVYMPFMHSESLAEHDRALDLFSEPGLAHYLEHEHKHRAVLERFGRYPQRNAALGRANTDEEAAFLSEPGSGF